ncbi:hypothetical protein JJB11_09080 [Ramlibacter ginsenosidimutans]|uniref:Uncharacterized protein n=1 Tax=Ramlibacter ginsenosidimutans TaxID=502333 RepID=A0A934TSL3_9BURK|nr:hypothetical protein [Ramlibacter ginsenosidimutans]MBK6006241.1 hypothetical protein [Ramlibacter ginsenosidimutans]
MDILNATRPAARVVRLQSHLQELLRITAANWGLDPPVEGPFLPPARLAPARAVAPVWNPPPSLRA